jgi:hypothetical protein
MSAGTRTAAGDSYSVPRRTAVRLAVLGGLALPFYLAAFFVLPQADRFRAQPTTSIITALPFWQAIDTLPDPTPTVSALLAGVMAVVVLGTYLAALWLAWRAPANRRTLAVVITVAVLAYLAGVFSLPNSSRDLYLYLIFARPLGIYGVNPYSVPLGAFPNDPYIQYASADWAASTMPYGPVWAFISAGVVAIAGDAVHRAVLLMRGVMFAFNLGNLALIAAVLRRLSPRHVLAGVLFYAWNPIVMFKGQSHNDAVMAFFVLLAFYLTLRGSRLPGLAATLLSVLTKFITAPLLLPHLAFIAAGMSRRTLWRLAALGGVITLAALIVLWPAREMIVGLARVPSQEPGTPPPMRMIVAALATLAVLPWAVLDGRHSPRALLVSWSALLLAFLYFFPNTSYAWYFITLLAVISLLDSPTALVLGATVTVSALLNNVLSTMVHPFVPLPTLVFQLIRWGLPLAVFAAVALYHARRRRLLASGAIVTRRPA